MTDLGKAFVTIPEEDVAQDVTHLIPMVRVVHAFADTRYYGNPAGVLRCDVDPDPAIMVGLARQMNLPVIVTLVAENDTTYRIQWFTQTAELQLCGHGTMAASYVLFDEVANIGSKIRFVTYHYKALFCELENGLITMEFPSLQSTEANAETYLAVEKLLGSAPLEIRRASDDLIAVLKNEQDVINYKPDLQAISSLDCRGLIITAEALAVGPIADFDIVSRFFAPQIGIDEDQVCISAHCKLQPYWSSKLELNRPLRALQASTNGGTMLLGGEGNTVKISGTARSDTRTTDVNQIKPAVIQPTFDEIGCGVRTVMTELNNQGINDENKKFSMAHFEVAPGGFSAPHEHAVSEIWCIVSGEGVVVADGSALEIGAGDFVHLEPGSSHQLRNSGQESIKAVSVWWQPETYDAIR